MDWSWELVVDRHPAGRRVRVVAVSDSDKGIAANHYSRFLVTDIWNLGPPGFLSQKSPIEGIQKTRRFESRDLFGPPSGCHESFDGD